MRLALRLSHHIDFVIGIDAADSAFLFQVAVEPILLSSLFVLWFNAGDVQVLGCRRKFFVASVKLVEIRLACASTLDIDDAVRTAVLHPLRDKPDCHVPQGVPRGSRDS